MTASSFEPGLDFARACDRADALAPWREQFWIPRRTGKDEEQIYFCGNSLGLQPKTARQDVLRELEQWQRHGVEGHFQGDYPWFRYHEFLRKPLAEMVGAKSREVVAMNSLTANLHLMLVSFYRPVGARRRIVIEKPAFPSDQYALRSQLRFHGHDPHEDLVELEDSPGTGLLSVATVEDYLERNGETVALLLLPGVQYYSGEFQDITALTRLAHRHGCRVGFDLAHAVGNVPLRLHEWGCDFAVWCSYKYLNAGPGAVAGCFVHQRHLEDESIPRFEGWWGNDPGSRFRMAGNFDPASGADAWQLSNPPVLSAAPLRASLEIFQKAGMGPLRAKSQALSGYLQYLLTEMRDAVSILTPTQPERRGCQLSLRITAAGISGREVFDALLKQGVVGDWREPNVIRVAPTPLYNRFVEVYSFVERLNKILRR